MPLIQQHNIGILPGSLKPGDIALKLNPESNLGPGWNKWGGGGFISNVISSLSYNPEYVHGGLAVGQGRLIEVNGMLPADNINGTRFFSNIYLTDIARDTPSTSYDVWRCADAGLGEDVAIQAYPFVAQGINKSWGYNLGAATASVGLMQAIHPQRPGTGGKPGQAPLRENPDAVDIALAEGRTFFCTQFVVWLYNVVSTRIQHRGHPAIPINDALAYPGMLAEVLQKRCSGRFTYVGCIRGVQ